jgi:mRNA interferase MazF
MEYVKDFDGWNEIAKQLNSGTCIDYFHERELWWCSVGVNIGHEEDGKGIKFRRPVVIFKKLNDYMFLGIPVSRKNRSNFYTVAIDMGDTKERYAKISQIRIFDSKRLAEKIGMITVADFYFIRKAVIDIAMTA